MIPNHHPSANYWRRTPGSFTGGSIQAVVIDVSNEAFIDLEREAAAAFARD